MTDIAIDFGRTSADYRAYRAGFPPQTFVKLEEYGIGLPDQTIVDLGTGTGTIACQLAAKGAHVTAVDVSAKQLDEARAIAGRAGLDVTFLEARAEKTGLAGGGFDAVIAGQCWHWFDRDAAAAEARRLLKSGGALVIMHFDWIPLPGNVVELTEALIQKANPAWTMGGGSGVHPRSFADLAKAGYKDLESFSFDVAVPYTHQAWRGRVRASAGVAASLPYEDVVKFDRTLAGTLKVKFPVEPLEIPHRVWALIGRSV
jgi:ubiquinone/menaquinone biosynthesis C-methylase UbiE